MTEIYLLVTKEIRIYSTVKTKLYFYTISGSMIDICMNDLEEGLNIISCCNSDIFGQRAMIALADSWIFELKRVRLYNRWKNPNLFSRFMYNQKEVL